MFEALIMLIMLAYLLDNCFDRMLTSLQVSQYLTGGLERARESLNEAAALRDRFVIGASVSRRVAAAAASAVWLSLFYFSLHAHLFLFVIHILHYSIRCISMAYTSI